ncbi:MAG: hypothetical protein Q4E16_00150 [Neisseria sp.]|nr:hypothetical protein [Neisseria sp.]
MRESLFQQFALSILKLHQQQTAKSWLAVQQGEESAVFSSPYAHIDGNYYFAVPSDCPNMQEHGIVLIEDEAGEMQLSWVGNTREVACTECVYRDACAALCRRGKISEANLDGSRVVEFCPAQGRLNIGNQDSALSPQHLRRALYPANERLQEFVEDAG